MPTVSRFHGIRIVLNWDDHAPPHFHAMSAESEASYEIESLERSAGQLPRRLEKMVLNWAALHQDELLSGWDRAKNFEMPELIAPLP